MNRSLEDILAELTEYVKENKPNYLYNDNFIPNKSTIFYSGPYWDEKEIIGGIQSFLTGKWLVAGEHVHKFEYEFSKYFGVKHSHMVNSGSSANLILIASLKKRFGWEDGDEIIVSPVGFPTTISVLPQNSLKPVFVDIEFDTLNFNISKIEEKITSKTRAIFVSPVLGNPPNMDYLDSLCKKHNIMLIGDNCDSLGSKYNGKNITDYYTAFSVSFFPSHHLAIGEAGMCCTNDEELKKLFVSYSSWGRHCWTKDTKILTIDGVKNIQDIVVGDKVFTHTGQYKNVYDVMCKTYSDKLYTIKSRRSLDIQITKEHPLFVKRGDDLVWLFAHQLQKGDFLTQKVPNEVEIPKNFTYKYLTLFKEEEFKLDCEYDLFRLMGYWLAEGSLAKANKGSNGTKDLKAKGKYLYHRVDFSFHKDEIQYIEDVKNLMKKYFNVSMCTEYKNNHNGVILKFKTRKGYEFFNQTFGTLAYNKKLPHNFIHYKKDLIKELIKGFWRGDGSDDFQSFTIATSSINLANQFKLILSRFNISPNIFIRTPDKHKTSIVNGKKIEAKRNLYNLQCYGDNALNMGLLLNESYEAKTPRNITEYFTEDNEYALFEIQDIIIENVENVMVYNIEVEDDHSYHANGIISHNCHCVGKANTLCNGSCGNRFDTWLTPEYTEIVDHRYIFSVIGYNLKVGLDALGKIGSVQLTKFDEIMTKRKTNKARIENILLKYVDNLKGVEMLSESDTCWFATPFICTDKVQKDKLVAFLEGNKIQTRNYFAGNILIHPGYKHLGDYKEYPNANKVLDTVFFIGCAPHYSEEVFDYIEEIFKTKWIN